MDTLRYVVPHSISYLLQEERGGWLGVTLRLERKYAVMVLFKLLQTSTQVYGNVFAFFLILD